MPELTDETLDAWLRPAAVTLDAEALALFKAAIAKVKPKLSASTAFHVVGVAYGVATDEGRSWFVDRVREADSDFVEVGQDELLGRLACCSILASLGNGKDTATLMCLLALSASFLSASPAEPELQDLIERTLMDRATSRRQRPEWKPVAQSVADVLAGPPQAAEEGEEAETELDVQARAIDRLAEALDKLAEQVEERAGMVEEEYNALWWSYTRRSITTGTAWQEVTPIARRVVLACKELGERVSLVPGPPIVRGLLALALEGHVDDKVTLSNVMLAAAEEGVSVAPNALNRLLPISTAVAQISELGSEGTTWSDVLAKTPALQLKVNTKHSALDSAMQLFREVEIGTLL